MSARRRPRAVVTATLAAVATLARGAAAQVVAGTVVSARDGAPVENAVVVRRRVDARPASRD